MVMMMMMMMMMMMNNGEEYDHDDVHAANAKEPRGLSDETKPWVCSTDRLLQLPVIHEGVLSPYAQVIASDDTGSFNGHGWPVILTGCNDGSRTFHATAVSVCTGKSASDYRWIGNGRYGSSLFDPVASSEEEDAEGDDGEGQAE